MGLLFKIKMKVSKPTLLISIVALWFAIFLLAAGPNIFLLPLGFWLQFILFILALIMGIIHYKILIHT